MIKKKITNIDIEHLKKETELINNAILQFKYINFNIVSVNLCNNHKNTSFESQYTLEAYFTYL